MFVYQRVLPEEHVHTCIIPWKGSDHYDTVTCDLFSWISNTAPLQTEKHETKASAKNTIWNPKRIKTTIRIFVCFFLQLFLCFIGSAWGQVCNCVYFWSYSFFRFAWIMTFTSFIFHCRGVITSDITVSEASESRLNCIDIGLILIIIHHIIHHFPWFSHHFPWFSPRFDGHWPLVSPGSAGREAETHVAGEIAPRGPRVLGCHWTWFIL